jgi:hypothetical protein
VKYLRRATSAAAGSGLGTTINEHKLRCTTSAAAGYGLGTTIKYLKRTTSGAAGKGQVQRSSTCAAKRAARRVAAWAPTIKYLRTTVDIGLCTTIKYLRGAAGLGFAALQASAWAPRSSTCDAQREPPRTVA